MKIRKTFILALFAVCMTLLSCGGDDGGLEGFSTSSDFLTVPATVTLDGNQKSAVIDVNSNCSWTITGMPSWFRVTPVTGSGNVQVNIIADANPSALSSRSATLTISTPDGLKFDIEVTQRAASESLTLNVEGELKFTADGGTRSIAVQNNSHWTVIGTTNWLELDHYSGEGNQDITLTVEPNTTEAERTTVLTVQGVTESASIKIRQEPLVTTLSLTPEKTTIDAGEHQVPVTLSGDAAWTASSDADWAVPDQLTGTGGTTVRITCSMNNSVNARSATITFKTSRVTLTCVITQGGGTAPTLTLPVISSITKYSAKVDCTYESPFTVTEYGFCMSDKPLPTLSDTKIPFTGTNTSGSFSTQLESLESAKTYYIRAYAVNSYGTSYSEEVSFTTGGTRPDEGDVVPPVLAPRR
jgi:hypothetical protein